MKMQIIIKLLVFHVKSPLRFNESRVLGIDIRLSNEGGPRFPNHPSLPAFQVTQVLPLPRQGRRKPSFQHRRSANHLIWNLGSLLYSTFFGYILFLASIYSGSPSRSTGGGVGSSAFQWTALLQPSQIPFPQLLKLPLHSWPWPPASESRVVVSESSPT